MVSSGSDAPRSGARPALDLPAAADGRDRQRRPRLRRQRRHRAPSSRTSHPQPGRPLPVRGAARRRRLGAPVRVCVSVGEHAGLQLLLPAAAAHTHARRLAELVRPRRVRRHGRGRQRARRRPRRRARESALLAEIAASLLDAARHADELDRIAAEPRAHCRSTGRRSSSARPAPRRATLPAHGRRAPRRHDQRSEGPPGSAAARRRLLPALGSLLGVAIDRERLAGEASRPRPCAEATR